MVWQGNYDKLFVGGNWAAPASNERIEVISPFTEQAIATVPAASPVDVDRAIAAARHAFDHGPWPKMAPDERMAIMRSLSALLAENKEELAQLITDEMGCPISVSNLIQVDTPRTMLDAFIEIASDYPFTELRQTTTGNGLVLREPKGVVAAVVPWNTPISATMMKLGPALLMGCTFVLKPATETPLSAYYLAELLRQAGVPEGVVSILPAGPQTAEYLVMHPGVDKVTFTGSTAVGQRLGGLCGAALKPITLELGGKSAAIFLDDADIPLAVETLRLGSLRNSGQVCSLKTRLVVSRRREAELLDHVEALVKSMPVGNPSDPTTQIGPMVTAKQQARVEGYIAKGLSDGARLVYGGQGRPAGLDHGWFVQPSILARVDPNSVLAQEEVFGPVLAVMAYDSEDEAVAIANNSQYGLNGAIYTADPVRGVEIAKRIKTGTVEVNGSRVGFHCPVGGVKMSGIGREAGREGFDAYTEIKTVGLPSDYAAAFAN